LITGPAIGGKRLIAPTTAYANAGGQGDRTAVNIVTVTGNFVPTQGSFSNLVNNSLVGNGGGGILVGPGVALGEAITYDFNTISAGVLRYVDEVTIQAVSALDVTIHWAWSVDGVNFSDACSPYALTGTPIAKALLMDPAGCRYLKWITDSGTWPNVYNVETTFKIAVGAT